MYKQEIKLFHILKFLTNDSTPFQKDYSDSMWAVHIPTDLIKISQFQKNFKKNLLINTAHFSKFSTH